MLLADISAGRLIMISSLLNAFVIGVRSVDFGSGQFTATVVLPLKGRLRFSSARFDKKY